MEAILETVNDVYRIIREEQEKRPYSMNIIDEIHANENAHTRILLKLLQYSTGGEFPILESFLHLANTLLSENCLGEPIKENVDSPQIYFNRYYLDGLIEGSGQGIVLENKIHNAKDQNAQIERYIQTVRKDGINDNRIFVIYLTRDGSKCIQDYSLTKSVKDALACDESSSGRFIKMNYREHILDWLKYTVLPNCYIKEELLISAIRQYIDHLEGLFSIRERDRQMNDEIRNSILDKLDLDSNNKRAVWESLSQECDKIQTVWNYMDGIRTEISNTAYRQIEEWSNEILEKISSSSDEWRVYRVNGFIQNYKESWGGDRSIHFEWWPLEPVHFAQPIYEFRFGLHFEQGREIMREIVKDKFQSMLEKIPGIHLYDKKSKTKLKHGSALFEKTYVLGKDSFFDTPDEEKKKFVQDVYIEFADFIRAFDLFIKEGNLK